jgi:hypothetical protein
MPFYSGKIKQGKQLYSLSLPSLSLSPGSPNSSSSRNGASQRRCFSGWSRRTGPGRRAHSRSFQSPSASRTVTNMPSLVPIPRSIPCIKALGEGIFLGFLMQRRQCGPKEGGVWEE